MAVVMDAQTPTSAGQLARTVALGGLAVLAVARIVLAAIKGPGAQASGLDEVLYLLPFVLAVVGAMWAAFRSRGRDLRFWALIATAGALSLAGEAYFSYYVLFVDPAGPPLPAPFELLHVCAIVLLLAMIVWISRFSGGLAQRFRFYFGVAAGAVLLFAATFEVFANAALFDVPGVGPGTVIVSSLYPVLGVLLAVGTLGVVFGWHVSRWFGWHRFVVASLLLEAVGLALVPIWLYSRVAGSTAGSVGAYSEIAMGIGPYLLFVGAVYKITSGEATDTLAPGPRMDLGPLWFRVLYPTALVLLVPLIGLHALAHEGTYQGTVLLAAAILLGLTLMTRSWFSALELLGNRRTSSADVVTGLGNERLLFAELEVAVGEAARWGGDVALVVLDIDDLSRVNDVFGHRAGDEVLRSIAGVLRRDCGDLCTLYRAGSDEFAVLAPGKSAAAAADLAKDLARRIEHDVACGNLPISVSAGVTSRLVSGEGASMVNDAFAALQISKITRRGSVTMYDPEAAPDMPTPEERLEVARKQAYLATVRALASAVDARDPASRDHSRHVGELARQLALELGMSPERASALETAGMLHDIGKLALPDELLWKHSALDENDKARLREHVELGERILRSTELGFMLPWVRAHHERWDGAGYPEGLAGERIPLEARILAVCDAFDAMTTGIAGAPALKPSAAVVEIEANEGTQFDPEVAGTFVRMQVRRLPQSAQ